MDAPSGYVALMCPACGGGQLWIRDGLMNCRQCGHEVRAEGGVHALALGSAPPADTQAGDVARAFFPTEAARRSHFRDLQMIIEQVMGRRHLSDVLEIGATGGAWTAGLSASDRVRKLYATETSAAALNHLVSIAAAPGTIILQSGAETLDFAAESLDMVVGRATLCQLGDPNAMLTRIRGWLKPGGAAIFLEPCLQGKIWAAFAMDLIRRFEEAGGPSDEAPASGGFLARKPAAKKGLSPLAMMRLEGGARQVLQGAQGIGRGEDRVFDISTLCGVGYEAGFAECFPIDQPQDEVTPLRRLKNTLEGLLGHEKGALERYAPVFEALDATFGALHETAPVAPMVYFVFRA
ncbi:class I SAM-dependent methyltransferase [Maritalea mobilis]|uniref:class I SAM-dependent methyltransferase n=1 Tax=Maritalea mobilis TaxID=483324 RepID=UPI001C9893A0|nr:class I SAM-dependent methyltransferase [Maritalea mobilis]MBY6202648.1 class I SAM-dependent methyltransferase [Maritalea mobilis]